MIKSFLLKSELYFVKISEIKNGLFSLPMPENWGFLVYSSLGSLLWEPCDILEVKPRKACIKNPLRISLQEFLTVMVIHTHLPGICKNYFLCVPSCCGSCVFLIQARFVICDCIFLSLHILGWWLVCPATLISDESKKRHWFSLCKGFFLL